ncbi:hypothetical protein [Paenibacillus oryzisoli]|uniref:DUF3139 domain-containing protein n=1 Tax=Paenibacillus oryzisoli TaxID=1850517 RepID=A0A198A8J2_9BACL|nr:hypothetical protein [Paenibacillus oryzisoli]OAS17391.1 hypothetical protein A8708_21705 [Paenibacillus oryzisoli]
MSKTMKTLMILILVLLLIILLPILSYKLYGHLSYKLDKKKGKTAVEEYFNKLKCSYTIEDIYEYHIGSWIAGYTNGVFYEVKGCDGEQYRVFLNTGTRDLILNGPNNSATVIKKIK